MRNRQVAVLDFGSSKITATVAERGINKTFIIKGSNAFNYDGFESGVFFDLAQLKQVVLLAIESLKKAYTTKLETVYVGVPGEFTEVVVKDSQISFAKKKKINDLDVDALFDSAFVMQSAKYTLINRSAVVYELDDFRRLANPVGAVSGILKGKLSFSLCTNYFIETVKSIILGTGVDKIEFISTPLAETLYLLDTETRDRIALVCDIGYISTTVTIIQGDGILYQKSFPYGGGYITADITRKLQIDFEDAEKLKRRVNLSQQTSSREFDLIGGENGEYYSVEDIKNIIKDSLDGLCEYIATMLDDSGYILPDYVPLMITGGGISYLRGAKEHVSDRLNMAVEIIAPKVPLMDKPTESSTLSLLDLALEQN